MRYTSTTILTLSLALCGLPASAASVLALRSDFESGLYNNFSGEADLAPLAKSNGAAAVKLGTLLHNDSGGKGARATTLTMSRLPAHDSIDLDFMLAIIGKWESGASSDKFNVYLDGKLIFAKAMAPFGATTGLVGAARLLDMGNFSEFKNVTHGRSDLRLDFVASGKGWKGGLDESWAIDNVVIMLNGVTTTTLDDCVTVVIPLPPSVQLGVAGLAAVFGLAIVRRRSLYRA